MNACDTVAARLREADGDRLSRRSRAVFALADVVHFLAYELSGLCDRRLSLPFIVTRASGRTFLRHVTAALAVRRSLPVSQRCVPAA